MKHSFLAQLILFLLIAAINGNAQTRVSNYGSYAARIISHYTDSLASLRERYDSAIATEHDALRDPYYFRMLLPGTFYSGVSGDLFKIERDDADEEPDYLRLGEPKVLRAEQRVHRQNQLLGRIYASDPSLIGYSDAAWAEFSGFRAEAQRPITEKSELAQQVEARIAAEVVEPVIAKPHRPNFWTLKQSYEIQLLQNYFSDNWYAGGNSNYSFLGNVTLKLNYDNQQGITFENTLEMKLGFQTTSGDSLHDLTPTNDRLRLTNKFNVQAAGNWYYSLQLVSTTQFVRHYDTNSSTVNSDFFSPFESVLSVGMDYKYNKNNLEISLNLAPVALDYTYVGREALAEDNDIEEGKHSDATWGSNITLTHTWKLLDELTWTGRLYYFTNYEKVQVEWEHTFTFTINKYLSTNLYVYPRFDDTEEDDEGRHRLQLKEYLSFGFSYSL